jgi:histidine triad (HIT) family protein
MSECPFCKRISAGEFESFTIDPFPSVVWFEPLNPVTPGHMLFVPVRHVEDALADPYTTAITAEIASRWWRSAWMARGSIPDCNLITSVGANATQSVRHLHLHLVPRREGDGLHLPWTGQDRRLRCQHCECLLDESPECGGSWSTCGHVDRNLRGCVIEPLLEPVEPE